MLQDYTHRVLEWIEYHLALGISGLLWFDHGSADNLLEVVKPYNNVFVIPFDYTVRSLNERRNAQRMALTIGSTVLQSQCQWICLIDADEFIYLPRDTGCPLGVFLQRYNSYPAVTLKSKLLTNKRHET